MGKKGGGSRGKEEGIVVMEEEMEIKVERSVGKWRSSDGGMVMEER